MKLTKIFGIVLSLHVAVILLVMFQPGCQTPSGGGDDEPAGDAFNASPEDGDTGGEAVAEAPEKERPRTSPTPPDGGFVPTEPVDPPDASGGLKTYTVVSGDGLESIAKRHGTTLERLLEINNIPEREKNKLSIGQELLVPGAAGSSSGSGDTTIIKPEDPEPNPTPVTPVRDVHVVESGDTLSKIAGTYGVSVSALKVKNNLQGDLIQIGQRLLIPVPSSAVVPVPEGPAADTSVAGQVVHVVKSGDNYTRIANRYGVTVADLKEWNPNANPNSLQLGQKLIVKAPSSPPPSEEDDDDSSDGAGKEEDSIDSLFNKPPVVPLPSKEEE